MGHPEESKDTVVDSPLHWESDGNVWLVKLQTCWHRGARVYRMIDWGKKTLLHHAQTHKPLVLFWAVSQELFSFALFRLILLFHWLEGNGNSAIVVLSWEVVAHSRVCSFCSSSGRATFSFYFIWFGWKWQSHSDWTWVTAHAGALAFVSLRGSERISHKMLPVEEKKGMANRLRSQTLAKLWRALTQRD